MSVVKSAFVPRIQGERIEITIFSVVVMMLKYAFRVLQRLGVCSGRIVKDNSKRFRGAFGFDNGRNAKNRFLNCHSFVSSNSEVFTKVRLEIFENILSDRHFC